MFRDPYVMYYLFAALIAFPVTLILKRAGLRRDYAALLAIPMVGLACCMGVMAFSRWPALLKEDK